MTVYTGRGDGGETDLGDGTRVRKTDPRIRAYGTVDEVNALIGTIIPTGIADIDEQLRSIQEHLFILQAQLARPEPREDDPVIRTVHVEMLEEWIDTAEEELDPLRSFILPGGSEAGATLHHARAVCRRSERACVALAEVESVDSPALKYLNRLSDCLFVMARLANHRNGIEERAPSY